MTLTKKQKEQKKLLIKGIHDNKQTRTFGWIVLVLLFWTGIGLIAGLIMILWASEAIRKKEQELVDLE